MEAKTLQKSVEDIIAIGHYNIGPIRSSLRRFLIETRFTQLVFSTRCPPLGRGITLEERQIEVREGRNRDHKHYQSEEPQLCHYRFFFKYMNFNLILNSSRLVRCP